LLYNNLNIKFFH